MVIITTNKSKTPIFFTFCVILNFISVKGGGSKRNQTNKILRFLKIQFLTQTQIYDRK